MHFLQWDQQNDTEHHVQGADEYGEPPIMPSGSQAVLGVLIVVLAINAILIAYVGEHGTQIVDSGLVTDLGNNTVQFADTVQRVCLGECPTTKYTSVKTFYANEIKIGDATIRHVGHQYLVYIGESDSAQRPVLQFDGSNGGDIYMEMVPPSGSVLTTTFQVLSEVTLKDTSGGRVRVMTVQLRSTSHPAVGTCMEMGSGAEAGNVCFFPNGPVVTSMDINPTIVVNNWNSTYIAPDGEETVFLRALPCAEGTYGVPGQKKLYFTRYYQRVGIIDRNAVRRAVTMNNTFGTCVPSNSISFIAESQPYTCFYWASCITDKIYYTGSATETMEGLDGASGIPTNATELTLGMNEDKLLLAECVVYFGVNE